MAQHVSGPFEVELTPQPAEAESAALGRMKIDKQFHGAREEVAPRDRRAMSR
jgi:hypothetical protein